MTSKNVWFITGAGRGMGLDIALAAGSRSFEKKTSMRFQSNLPRTTFESLITPRPRSRCKGLGTRSTSSK
jgi:hypothetical protein